MNNTEAITEAHRAVYRANEAHVDALTAEAMSILVRIGIRLDEHGEQELANAIRFHSRSS